MTVPTHSYPSICAAFDTLEQSNTTQQGSNLERVSAGGQVLVLFDVLPLACLTPEEVAQFEFLATNSPTQAETLDALASGRGVSCVTMLDTQQVACVLKGIPHEALI